MECSVGPLPHEINAFFTMVSQISDPRGRRVLHAAVSGFLWLPPTSLHRGGFGLSLEVVMEDLYFILVCELLFFFVFHGKLGILLMEDLYFMLVSGSGLFLHVPWQCGYFA